MDGGVIEETEFYQRLKNGSLNLTTLQEAVENVNFVFLADDAFALREHLLQPFLFQNPTGEQRIYNYQLSRARRVVENAFRILADSASSLPQSIFNQSTIFFDTMLQNMYLLEHIQEQIQKV